MKRPVTAAGAPAPIGPYSQAIVAGSLVFISGQIALTSEGNLLSGSVEDETGQIMKNLQAILSSAGVGFDDVVKTTVYLTDMSLFPEVNSVYGSYLKEPYPARESIGIASLPLGARIEISLIALAPTTAR